MAQSFIIHFSLEHTSEILLVLFVLFLQVRDQGISGNIIQTFDATQNTGANSIPPVPASVAIIQNNGNLVTNTSGKHPEMPTAWNTITSAYTTNNNANFIWIGYKGGTTSVVDSFVTNVLKKASNAPAPWKTGGSSTTYPLVPVIILWNNGVNDPTKASIIYDPNNLFFNANGDNLSGGIGNLQIILNSFARYFPSSTSSGGGAGTIVAAAKLKIAAAPTISPIVSASATPAADIVVTNPVAVPTAPTIVPSNSGSKHSCYGGILGLLEETLEAVEESKTLQAVKKKAEQLEEAILKKL